MLAPGDKVLRDSLGHLEALALWTSSARAACDTLSSMPPHLMNSITVTGRPNTKPEQLRLLRAYCLELAERHGYHAALTVDAQGFTVTFSRGPTD